MILNYRDSTTDVSFDFKSHLNQDSSQTILVLIQFFFSERKTTQFRTEGIDDETYDPVKELNLVDVEVKYNKFKCPSIPKKVLGRFEILKINNFDFIFCMDFFLYVKNN